jgi:hypothetical protein
MKGKIIGKRVLGSLVILVLPLLFISVGHDTFSTPGDKESKVVFVVT